MISFILATSMLLDTQTYEASDLNKETIYNIEHANDSCPVASIGMFYIEEPETEGLFPIRRPTPAPSRPAPEAPSMGGDDYLFPIAGRLFWGLLKLPAVQLILVIIISISILKSIYGPAWVAGFITDIVTQVRGLFQGLSTAFKKEDDNEELNEEEWEWVEEDE